GRSQVPVIGLAVHTGYGPVDRSELVDLYASLAKANGEIACLSRELSAVREEHDHAVDSLGGLTVQMAKMAAEAINVVEVRVMANMKGMVSEFERLAAFKHEEFVRHALSTIAEGQASSR
ncbi:unnamed protein product, partial [Polarella glacialis]